MGKYNWKAIPEGTWAAFILALTGLSGALCVALGVPEYLTVAIVAFIGAFFRLLVALAAAFFSADGTVTSGTGTAPNPIPPSE